MIKTTAIVIASAASLGAAAPSASTPTALDTPSLAHFEISAGPLNIIRDKGETHFKIDASSNSLFRVELASGKTLNIQL